MPPFARSALSLLLAFMWGSAWPQGVPLFAELGVNALRFKVEVASTPSERQAGLMHRKTLPAQQGMLFVYPQSDSHCMWMKNTLIPLSVAFIDGNGRILNIEDMQPNTRDYHCARAPALYALEMNLGWFRSKGINTGDKVRGLQRLTGQNNN